VIPVSRYCLILDFGHGGGRAFFYDIDSGNHVSAYQKWSYFSPEDDEFRKEFIPDDFFKILCDLTKTLIKKHHIQANEVIGLSSGCMRHTFVFLDEKGQALYGGPNTDTRGMFYQDVVEEDSHYDLYQLAGQWPPLLYLPSRLLWFKEEKPEIYGKIAYALSTGDWLNYQLSSKMVTEPSLASSTLLFDLRKGIWLDDVLEDLGLHDIELPQIGKSGDYIGGLTDESATLMGLKPDIPIVLGGGDTQLGLLSCNAVKSGDIGIVAGTSTPVMMVIDKAHVDSKRRIWTGSHILNDTWVLESNAQMAGLIYEWLKNNFQSILGKSNDEMYAYMENIARQVPPGSNDVIASLGTEIFNIQTLSVIRPSIFTFHQPVHPMNENPVSFADFTRAALENISYAIKGNIEQLRDVAKTDSEIIYITGGMTKNDLWLEILADVTNKTVLPTRYFEGTSIGGVICTSVGVGVYNDFTEAAENIVCFKNHINPDEKKVEIYKRTYHTWKEWYDKLGEF
jgi:autoinducer 2 (AI-2) kinase